jgi:hypothetical protein
MLVLHETLDDSITSSGSPPFQAGAARA